MMEPVRRQILADMGITLWRLRVGEGEQEEGALAPVGDRDREIAPTKREESRSGDRSHKQEESRSGDRSHKTESRSYKRKEPWSVVSLVLGDVVLLADGVSSRRDLRLAQDVLTAASGQWQGRPARRRFNWPPEVGGAELAAGPDAGGRALRAFVDKDVADHAARLLLCTEPVRQRLEGEWKACRLVTVPALDVLGRDPDAKRALWRAIEECRP